MADDFHKFDLIILQLGKNKEVTHLNFVIKLIINEIPMVVHLKQSAYISDKELNKQKKS